MSSATTDLCDANEDKIQTGALRILPPGYLAWGKRLSFQGQAHTLRLFEDNSLVRSALETSGEGKVLVVDGGGSLRCALLGGNLGVLAEKNGWAGVVVHGCVRDSDELDACDLGVRALGVHPQKSQKKGVGQENVQVIISGVVVRPNDWIYADRDGVLVSDTQL